MLIDAKFLRRTIKPRNAESHKGENGRVLFVGGSRLYFGSPALAALSALRAGADLVYLLVPEYIAPTVASYSPDLIVWGYKGEFLNKSALQFFHVLKDKTDAMVIGNGLTKNSDVLKTAEKMILEYKKPCVVDADAIVKGGYGVKNAVYTPHVMEFGRLSGMPVPKDISARKSSVQSLAKRLGAPVLLKGKTDVISDGKNGALNNTGNAGMTAGGTGDTLAGILGAFLSQGYSGFDAACMAAYVNGAAGDLAYKKHGNSLIASDLIKEVANVLKTLHYNRMAPTSISNPLTGTSIFQFVKT